MNKLPNAVKWLIVLAVLGPWGPDVEGERPGLPRGDARTGQHLRHLPQCKLDLKKAAHLLSEDALLLCCCKIKGRRPVRWRADRS